MVQAQLVSSRRKATSAGSVEGLRERHSSFAGALTACSESIFRTAGSSSVDKDFSKKLITYTFNASDWKRILFQYSSVAKRRPACAAR